MGFPDRSAQVCTKAIHGTPEGFASCTGVAQADDGR